MQIASAVARAEHAEQNLRQQTELLDEMAELAAEKEATLAQVVTLRQESDARALEIDLLSSDARLSSEAAAMWEARAKAAEKLVDERARVAEEAAAAVKMAADERLRVLEDGDGACVADVDEQAVAAAAEVRAEAIAADAELKIYAVSRESDSLKRALAAANHGVELWKAKAQAAEADLEKALAEPDAVSRRAGGGGGRLTAYGFVEGKDLRSFLVRGTPRVSRDDERDADVVHELESVGARRAVPRTARSRRRQAQARTEDDGRGAPTRETRVVPEDAVGSGDGGEEQGTPAVQSARAGVGGEAGRRGSRARRRGTRRRGVSENDEKMSGDDRARAARSARANSSRKVVYRVFSWMTMRPRAVRVAALYANLAK